LREIIHLLSLLAGAQQSDLHGKVFPLVREYLTTHPLPTDFSSRIEDIINGIMIPEGTTLDALESKSDSANQLLRVVASNSTVASEARAGLNETHMLISQLQMKNALVEWKRSLAPVATASRRTGALPDSSSLGDRLTDAQKGGTEPAPGKPEPRV